MSAKTKNAPQVQKIEGLTVKVGKKRWCVYLNKEMPLLHVGPTGRPLWTGELLSTMTKGEARKLRKGLRREGLRGPEFSGAPRTVPTPF